MTTWWGLEGNLEFVKERSPQFYKKILDGVLLAHFSNKELTSHTVRHTPILR